MKKRHLFYISNYISFNNYLSLIEDRGIELSNCYFYSPRLLEQNLNITKNLNFFDFDKYSFIKNNNKFLVNTKSRYFLKNINRLLKKKKYVLYIPHLINIRERLLLNNKYCESYFFVEEGTTSYRKDFNYNSNNFWSEVIIKKRQNIYNLRNCHPLTIYLNKYSGCVANTEISFKRFPLREQKKLRFNHIFKKKHDFSKIKGCIVLALDSPYSWNDYNNYMRALEKLVKHFKDKKVIKIYIKAHPDFSKKETSKIINFYKSNDIEVDLLDKDFFIEECSFYINDFKLYNLKSALLVYAGLNNVNITIFDKNFQFNDRTYEIHKNLNEEILNNLGIEYNYI